jgi:hypothetical protein
MADGISSIASVQLSVLQLPEVVREQTPVLLQSQIIASQVPAIIRQQDEVAAETVQVLEQASNNGVPDALSHHPPRERPAYREPVRGAVQEKVTALAAADPRGLGRMVDVRA